MNPYFSIIIPLYNSAATLPATLKSIAKQAFKNFEVVFADGASTDATLNLIATFKTTNPTIQTTLLSAPDKGIYDAMNKGIVAAKGRWLYFMGGDDTLQSAQVLAKVYEVAEQDDIDLIHGNVTGFISGTVYADDTTDKVLYRGIHHQGIFYKKTVFDYTGEYNLRFKVAADYHLTLKVFLNKAFKTRYADIDVASFGEAGLSSQQYDWVFYSYYYRQVAIGNKGAGLNENILQCLNNSVYACFQLAKMKQSLGFAWQNLLFYTIGNNGLKFNTKFRNLLRMCYWTLRPNA